MENISYYQDKLKRVDQLSFIECINIQCDAEAKDLIQK